MAVLSAYGGSANQKGIADAGNRINSEKQMDNQTSGKHIPVQEDAHSKSPNGKIHTPHSEELPHIHKFHKERVKKIKKHNNKLWLLGKLLLALCHISILTIAYLHVIH